MGTSDAYHSSAPSTLLQLLFCTVLCCALTHSAVGELTERPQTDNVCVIHLIGVPGAAKKPEGRIGPLERASFNCTGIKLPVRIRVHPSLLPSVTFQEGVQLLSDAEVRGLIQFEDARSLTILDSVFERLMGGGLAPVVFDRSAGLFYNCRFANNAYARMGGIYVSGGSLMHVYDSVFEGNKGTKFGAVMSTNGCKTLFRQTQFLNNQGGKHNNGASGFVSGAVFAFQSTLTQFEGCEWRNNVVRGAGAGAFLGVKRAVVNITDCVIEQNAGTAGALSMSDLSHGQMTRTRFVKNRGHTDGAPIDLILGSKLTISESQLEGNKGVSGVIVARDSSELYLSTSSFIDNTGTTYAGAVSSLNGGTIHIDKCEFSDNSGAFGGALYQNRAQELKIVEGKFTANTAQFAGGALFQKDVEKTELNSCVFSYNEGGAVGGGVSQLGCGIADWLSPRQQDMVTCGDHSTPNCETVKITDSSFEGNQATVEGTSIFHDRCKNVIVTSTTFSDEDASVVQKRCEQREFTDNTQPTTPNAISLLNCPQKTSTYRKLLSNK